MTETVEFHGATFHVAEKVGLMPLMRFAKVARSGVDANELEGLAAMYDILQQAIHPDDWARFEQHANDTRVDGDDLMRMVSEVMAVIGARPTGRSSVSSDGPQIIEPRSTDVSSSPAGRVIDRFNSEGRPDLALLVRRREESSVA